MTGTIPGAPLLPGSIQLQFLVEQDAEVPNNAFNENFDTFATTYHVTRTLFDDTQGNWQGVTGTIDYQTGEFVALAEADYQLTKHTNEEVQEWRYMVRTAKVTQTQRFVGDTVTAIAQASNLSHQPYTETLTKPDLTIDLLPLVNDPLLPNSVVFEWNGETYFDRNGLLYKSISTQTNAGLQVGLVDYTGGTVTLSSYPSGHVPTVNVQSAASIGVGYTTHAVSFRTSGSPLRAGSLQVTAVRADNAEIITASADFNGDLNTDAIQGSVNARLGWAEFRFTDGTNPIPVIPQSVRYNAIVETSLPLDAELIGLDPVRLPPDGKVPIYRAGDIVVVSHTSSTPVSSLTAGSTIQLARDHQAEITLIDSEGRALAPEQFQTDRTKGTLTFNDPLSLIDEADAPLTAPFTVKDRVEHMSVVNDVQVNGDLSIIAPVPWDLPAEETTVSSAVVYGDLQARQTGFFTQKVWDNGNPNWADQRSGEQTTAQYNHVNYPVEVTNKGAIFGQWALIFTSSSAFHIVEEKLGIIASGTTSVDVAPINPETGVPYFTLRRDGWGSGWAVGNAIRFNTDGCLAPVWICRTVLSGQATETNDDFTLQIRGDAD